MARTAQGQSTKTITHAYYQQYPLATKTYNHYIHNIHKTTTLNSLIKEDYLFPHHPK